MTQEIYFRPPSEADSFIVRVMHGCPHNKCTFCNIFKGVSCKVISLEEVRAGLERDADQLGPQYRHLVKSIYLEGGDPLALRSQHLLAIMEHAKRVFPAVNRFGCYATARFAVKKKPHEFMELAQAGLQRVFVGLESGWDAILLSTNKGCTGADICRVAHMLTAAGIEMDASMMLGIGGKDHSIEHAIATARLINAAEPHCVRIRTFAPKKGTVLGDDCVKGSFVLMNPHEIMRELRMLVENVTAKTQLLSEHWTNYVLFDAHMPEAKQPLLAHIDEHLAMPPESFRALEQVRSQNESFQS